MGIWTTLLRQRAEDWTYLELDGSQVPTGIGHEPIAADAAYITVRLRSLRVVDVRRGRKRIYGAVQSWTSIPHIGTGSAQFHVVTTPSQLKDADARRLDRVISMDRTLLGPVPYRGGNLELELGLFSLVAQELVGPFLDVLEAMSNAAGVTFVSAARPFVEPLARGIDILTGTAADIFLEIGLSRQWEPTTGYYTVVRAPRGTIADKDVRVEADQRLVDASGAPVRDYPYVVFSIEATRERRNWFEIPELSKAYEGLKSDVLRARIPDVKEAFGVFRRTTLTSPDLLFEDAQSIVDRVDTEVTRVLRSAQTGGFVPGEGPMLPNLSEFSPYT